MASGFKRSFDTADGNNGKPQKGMVVLFGWTCLESCGLFQNGGKKDRVPAMRRKSQTTKAALDEQKKELVL